MLLVIVMLISLALAQGALIWLVAYALAPAERDFSLLRGILIGFAWIIIYNLIKGLIKPKFGEGWELIISLVGTPIVFKFGFCLSVIRSILATVIVWIVVMAAMYFLLIRPDQMPT